MSNDRRSRRVIEKAPDYSHPPIHQELPMNKIQTNTALMLAGLALLGAAFGSMPARADNVAQTVELVKVDVQKLSTGYRASKIIGSNVVNDASETIGKIDDLIVSP